VSDFYYDMAIHVGVINDVRVDRTSVVW